MENSGASSSRPHSLEEDRAGEELQMEKVRQRRLKCFCRPLQ